MHHDTITGTSRNYVINHEISQIEGLLTSNSKMISLLLMKQIAQETVIKVNDYMEHLRAPYQLFKLNQPIDLGKSNTLENLVYIYNPSLGYLDTTLIEVMGYSLNKVRVYVLRVINDQQQQYHSVPLNPSIPGTTSDSSDEAGL